MKRYFFILIHFSLFLLSVQNGNAQEQFIVKYKEGVSSGRAYGSSLGNLGGEKVGSLEIINAEVYKFNHTPSAEELERFLDENSDIKYIEPDQEVKKSESSSVIPNDEYFSLQWGLHNTGQTGGVEGVDIGAARGWNYGKGSRESVIAVLDTGIDYTHPDLKANLWTNSQEVPNNGIDDDRNGIIDDVYGADMLRLSGDPIDEDGHGTHVAGIIGAVSNNKIGVSGVAWNTRLLAVKVLGADGSGTTSSVIYGIQYIVNLKAFQGVNIAAINASLGSYYYSDAMYDAIRRARSAGIMLVAAAGNDSVNIDNIPSFPAAYDLDNIVSVAAVDDRGTLASFSNFGRYSVDMAAPGVNILSTCPTYLTPEGYEPYCYLSGTSQAAPYITGIIALLHERANFADYEAFDTPIFLGVKSGGVLAALGGLIATPGITAVDEAMSIFDSFYWDSDGDGVGDDWEGYLGTNPDDRGSFPVELENPTFAKYNTFLGMYNFLELIAGGDETVQAELNVFAIDGSHLGAATIRLDPGQQFHVDINQFVPADTYGLVRIDFNESYKAKLYGRMTNYRPIPGSDDYSFAFTRELRNAMRGPSHATANSMDPSGNEQSTPNWAEVVNLSDQSQRFTHLIYAQNGDLIKRNVLTLAPMSEIDVQAGHEFGPGVYLNEFIPHNPRAPYLASVSRYRINEWGTDYSYAFSIDAIAATGSEKYVPTFRRKGACWEESTWIEVVNVTDQIAPVTLMLRDSSGNLLKTIDQYLEPKSQQHFNASQLLALGKTGWASITPWLNESIVSQSLIYYHDCRHRAIQTAFVLPATVAKKGDLLGTFNSHLGMTNQLSAINIGRPGARDTWLIELFYPQGTDRYYLNLNTMNSLVAAVTDSNDTEFGEASYGTLSIEDDFFDDYLIAHNLLVRERSDGGMNYVIPTRLY